MSVRAPEFLSKTSLPQNTRPVAEPSLRLALTRTDLRCENECLAKPKLPVPVPIRLVTERLNC